LCEGTAAVLDGKRFVWLCQECHQEVFAHSGKARSSI
jgi:hypothetical protein